MAEVVRSYSNFERTSVTVTRIRSRASKADPRPIEPAPWQPHALEVRLGREVVQQILCEYRAGDGCTVLSRRHRVSENAILALLNREGVTLRPSGKVTPEDVVEMGRLRQEGWTYWAIGVKFGVTRVAVSRRLRA